MKEQQWTRRQLLGAAAAASTASVAGLAGKEAAARNQAPLLPDEMADVDFALGKKGDIHAEEAVYTISLPRNDWNVVIRSEPLPVPFGLTGWVSFKKSRDGHSTLLVGEAPLLPEEVDPVVTAAQVNGIEVLGIHHRFLGEEPRVMVVRLLGMGTAEEVANGFATAIRASRLHPSSQPPVPGRPAVTAHDRLDLPRLDEILGHEGAVHGVTYSYTAPRRDLTVEALGTEITAWMGLCSRVSFTGETSSARLTGSMALLEPEANPVIAALRRHDIQVTGLVNGLLGEEPRTVLLEFFGSGNGTGLARGFRAALDELGKHGRIYHLAAGRGPALR